jgi:RHS repeat-associated protein
LAGNLATFADAGGTVTYSYDAANELAALTDPNSKQTTFAYDNDHNRTQITYPNGVVQLMAYDASDRLTSVVGKKPASNTILTSLNYGYTASGQDTALRQSVTDGVSGQTTTYGYDYANRLASATSPTNTYQYAYDADGNRLTATVNGSTTNATYNAADELTQLGMNSFTSDANGNLMNTSAALSLSYNPKDQTVAAGSSSMTYLGAGQELRTGVGTTTFQTSDLGLTIQNDTAGSTYFTRDPGGTLISERTPGATYYYLTDAIGSVIAVTDSAGTVAATYTYDPYGKLVASTGSIANPYRFAGEYYDSASGLYKIGARYYDAGTGRWTAPDPVTSPLEPHGSSSYLYAGDDPVNFTDPAGTTIPWDPHSYGAHAGDPCKPLRGAALRRCAYKSWSAEAYCSTWYCPQWSQSWSTTACAGYAIRSLAFKPFTYSLKEGVALMLGRAAVKFNPYTAAGSLVVACLMHGFSSQYNK